MESRVHAPAVSIVVVTSDRKVDLRRCLGARCARGAVVIYRDDDAWPHDGWLAKLFAAFADERVLAASGPVVRGDGSLQCARLAASPIDRLIPIAEDAPLPRGMSPSFSGCNLAIRRSALFACGGFVENLPYQPDDMDVCSRLFAHAGRNPAAMCYRPRAVVTHESSPGPFRRTLQDRAWFTVARDNLYFAFRHGGVLRGALGGGRLQLPKLLRFGSWLVRGKLGPAAFVRCLGKHLAGYGKGLLCAARLPLQPLPAERAVARPTTTAAEEPACRPPQPV